MFNSLELTGRSSAHVREVPELGCTLHAQAVPQTLALCTAARAAGIELAIVSSFRDFERQVAIWNAKFTGERQLLDRDGRALAHAQLSERALIDAILIWSALPGASRHHWGTDIDVVDRAAVAPDYRPQLVPAEFASDGPFAHLDAWLAANMAAFGFFRPYTTDRGGVQPEPWHLSFAPLAEPALAALTPQVLSAALCASAVRGRDAVLARLPEIHARYVTAIDPPPVNSPPTPS
ncbi:MAG TPA: M15 family metallopeptidase [Steroidobacteraceae bacterium]|jgi:LAS superfamily LD-carboxypeptidase LdcB|nr:M15 family metallopeptidase [Steroidobacteraceae bacterium]